MMTETLKSLQNETYEDQHGTVKEHEQDIYKDGSPFFVVISVDVILRIYCTKAHGRHTEYIAPRQTLKNIIHNTNDWRRSSSFPLKGRKGV